MFAYNNSKNILFFSPGVATFCRNHVTPFQAEDRIQLSSSDNDNTTEENCFTNGNVIA